MGKSFEQFDPLREIQILDYLKGFIAQEEKRFQGQVGFLDQLRSEIKKTARVSISGVDVGGPSTVTVFEPSQILQFSNLDKLEKLIVSSEGLNIKKSKILLESPYVKNEIEFCRKIFGRAPMTPDFVLTSSWAQIRALTSLGQKRLKDLVCVKLKYCQNKDKHLIKIIVGLADLAGLGGYASISWLIGTGYFDRLCQCGKKQPKPQPKQSKPVKKSASTTKAPKKPSRGKRG